ncbi:MAG TPA: nucleotidyl transferase AbiEii/AbiGii toxin family protein [Pyrinomonadaceae bacterium]
MNDVIQAAAQLQQVCESEHWHFCFIGGLALQRWGQPRETVDVDLTLLTGFGKEDFYIERLMRSFGARIKSAADFARDRRVLLLNSEQGVGLDIALAALPFEESVIKRSSLFRYPPNFDLRTCSAEDLIVLKAFANRYQDWADIEGIIARQADNLDWSYIVTELEPLADLKETPQIMEQLNKMRDVG